METLIGSFALVSSISIVESTFMLRNDLSSQFTNRNLNGFQTHYLLSNLVKSPDRRHLWKQTPKELSPKKPLFQNYMYYQPFYCEENVWHMCNQLNQTLRAKADVIFISNPGKKVPLWCQRFGNRGKSGFVFWTYHVILLLRANYSTLVFDLDSSTPFPTNFKSYFEQCIRDETYFRDSYKRYFRVISAPNYLKYFASDRIHTLDYYSTYHQPPSWPKIQVEEWKNNLQYFSDVNITNRDNPMNIISDLYDIYEFKNEYLN